MGWEDPMEKEMATHFSILAWEIPWTENPMGGCSPQRCTELGVTEATQHAHTDTDLLIFPSNITRFNNDLYTYFFLLLFSH